MCETKNTHGPLTTHRKWWGRCWADWGGVGESDWGGVGESDWGGVGESDWGGVGESVTHKASIITAFLTPPMVENASEAVKKGPPADYRRAKEGWEMEMENHGGGIGQGGGRHGVGPFSRIEDKKYYIIPLQSETDFARSVRLCNV